MTSRQLFLVARQTYLTRIKSFGYWALVLAPVLIVGVIAGITFIITATQSHKTPVVGVVNQPALTTYLKKTDGFDAKVKSVATEKQAKADLRKGKLDAYLKETGETKFQLVASADGESVSETKLKANLTSFSMLNTAAEINLSGEDLQKFMTPPVFKTTTQSDKGQSAGGAVANSANTALASAIGILIFVFLTSYISMIAQEIANEKSSRIMEILLAATSPAVQFFGKLSGIAGLALTHGLLYVIAGLLVNVFAPHYKYLKMIKELLAGVDAGFAIMTLLIALVAIFMYMVLTAIVAAMVNDLSQVQQAVAPITYLAMIGYVLTFTLSGQPNNTFLNILSYVPFISQTLMPARLGLQYATMGDAAIALVLEVIVLVFISMFGLRVYKRNVLTYNDGNITKAALASLKGLFVKTKD